MADVKIQDLLSATTVADTDLFIVEDNADTKKITKANLVETLGINGKADYEKGTFNVTDASGAGLIFTYVTQGHYVKIGKLVTLNFDITFPTNSSGAFAQVGVPFNQLSFFGGVIGYHTVLNPVLMFGGNFYNQNGGAYTNAQLSGKRIAGSITYIST